MQFGPPIAIAVFLASAFYLAVRSRLSFKFYLCATLVLAGVLYPLLRLYWSKPFTLSIVIGGLQAAIYLICLGWENRLPAIKYELFSRDFAKGFAFILLQPLIAVIGSVYLRKWLAPWLGELSGLESWGAPLWLQIVLFTLAYDLKDYVHHRINHRVDFFWRFHKIHHSPLEITSVSWANRSFVDLLLLTMPLGVALSFVMDVQPVVLPVAIFVQFVLGGPFAHANVDFPKAGTTPLWSQFLASPSFHRHHHSANHVYGNYAIAFPFWDRLFGTFSMPREIPRDFGVGSHKFSNQGFLSEQLAPFQSQSRFED